jgi:Domain of unknown function (DUF5655)/Domain of unknown function (DUF4287)
LSYFESLEQTAYCLLTGAVLFAMSPNKKFSYSVHPGIAMVQTSMKKLVERTGLTIDEWVKRVEEEGPASAKERREWLKNEHGITTNYASWIAERADGRGAEDTDPDAYFEAADRYVESMFLGPKAALRPLYEALLEECFKLGKDVKACPCQTIVPLYRNHVFAQIKPSTRTRIDFGLALKDTPAVPPLIDTGGFAKKDRISHRIAVSSVDDINNELKRWLRIAYEMDA